MHTCKAITQEEKAEAGGPGGQGYSQLYRDWTKEKVSKRRRRRREEEKKRERRRKKDPPSLAPGSSNICKLSRHLHARVRILGHPYRHLIKYVSFKCSN